MTSLKTKMANICSVPKRTISYDKVISTYTCNCGCGMELSDYCLAEARRHDSTLFQLFMALIWGVLWITGVL